MARPQGFGNKKRGEFLEAGTNCRRDLSADTGHRGEPKSRGI